MYELYNQTNKQKKYKINFRYYSNIQIQEIQVKSNLKGFEAFFSYCT